MRVPKKILIVRTDRIGDVVLSTPVIANLRRQFPEAHIAFMCRPYTKELLEENPYLNELIVYDKHGKDKTFLSTVKFIKKIRARSFDLALILHPTNRAHIITFFAGIKRRIGWNSKAGWLLTDRLENIKHLGVLHERDYTLSLLESVGVKVDDRRLTVVVKDQAEKRVKALLLEKGVGATDKILLVNPSASCPSKRWPIDHFAEMINFVKDHAQVKVVLVSDKADKHFSDKLVSCCDLIDLRGAVSLSELAALINYSDILVSNDSGPVHIAAALNRPVISIFGRADKGLSPDRWRPLGENSYFFHKDVGCTECLAHNCQKGFVCLRSVSPEDVGKLAITLIR
ncbi:MAG: lipopolysaccharide heptosyltransferase II [Candidatus Omnitrophica bacterium]|nr:lipopolysaccharide heptosyltransferase II [Candidatus Omnitrophota bacterium]